MSLENLVRKYFTQNKRIRIPFLEQYKIKLGSNIYFMTNAESHEDAVDIFNRKHNANLTSTAEVTDTHAEIKERIVLIASLGLILGIINGMRIDMMLVPYFIIIPLVVHFVFELLYYINIYKNNSQ